MFEYWFVVKPDHQELYEALRGVLASRLGYHVIKERRLVQAEPRERERRTATVWTGDGVLIAEHWPASHPAASSDRGRDGRDAISITSRPAQ